MRAACGDWVVIKVRRASEGGVRDSPSLARRASIFGEAERQIEPRKAPVSSEVERQLLNSRHGLVLRSPGVAAKQRRFLVLRGHGYRVSGLLQRCLALAAADRPSSTLASRMRWLFSDVSNHRSVAQTCTPNSRCKKIDDAARPQPRSSARMPGCKSKAVASHSEFAPPLALSISHSG